MDFIRRHWQRVAVIVALVVALALFVRPRSMRNFVDLIIGTAWPIAGVLIALIFRDEIIRLVRRVKKFSKDGFEFEPIQMAPVSDPASANPIFQGVNSTRTGLPTTSVGAANKTPIEAFIAPAFRAIFNQTLKQAKERLPALRNIVMGDDTEIALGMAAELAAAVHLERASRNIFQSQIDALNELQFRKVTKEMFKSFYDTAAQTFPAVYTGYSFDQWFNFLIAMGLIAGTDDSIVVTPAGEALNMYMGRQHYTPASA